jgi:hypothetical protein
LVRSTASHPARPFSSNATETDLYEVLDWLLERKLRIETKLAERHLSDDGMVLDDEMPMRFIRASCVGYTPSNTFYSIFLGTLAEHRNLALQADMPESPD